VKLPNPCGPKRHGAGPAPPYHRAMPAKWKRDREYDRRHLSGQCAVCGAAVLWVIHLALSDDPVPVLLCNEHQAAFGRDYPRIHPAQKASRAAADAVDTRQFDCEVGPQVKCRTLTDEGRD